MNNSNVIQVKHITFTSQK